MKRIFFLTNTLFCLFFLILFYPNNSFSKVELETAGASITEAKNSIAIAKNEKVVEYAPDEFAKAESLLLQAEEMMSKKKADEAFELAFLADTEAKIAIAIAREAKARYRIEKAKENQIETILDIQMNETAIAKTRQAIAERIALSAQINSEISSESAEYKIQKSIAELDIAKAELEIKLLEYLNAQKYAKQEYDNAKISIQEAKVALTEEDFIKASISAKDAIRIAQNAQIQAKAKSDEEFADTMKKREMALTAIAKAEIALEDAKASNADKLAKDIYDQAEKTMKETKASYADGDYEKARSLAEQTRVSASSAKAVVNTKERDEKSKEEAEEKKAYALDMIAKAERSMAQAFNAGSAEFASDLYKQSQTSLENAKQALQNNDFDKSISSAQESIFNSNLATATSELKSSQQKKNNEAEKLMVEEAKKIPNVSVRQTEKGVVISFSIDIFEKNGEIKKDFIPKLKTIAEFLKKFPNYRVIVEGHTDNSGKENANIYLSSDRATSILNYMASSEGVPLDRLSSVGYGSAKPIASNSDDAGRKQNRRIDIVILTR